MRRAEHPTTNKGEREDKAHGRSAGHKRGDAPGTGSGAGAQGRAATGGRRTTERPQRGGRERRPRGAGRLRRPGGEPSASHAPTRTAHAPPAPCPRGALPPLALRPRSARAGGWRPLNGGADPLYVLLAPQMSRIRRQKCTLAVSEVYPNCLRTPQ